MAAPAAVSQQRGGPHPALSRPALLVHVFKFVVRDKPPPPSPGEDDSILPFVVRALQDVTKLLHVASAWEDTCVNYSPLMWQRLAQLARVEDAPLEGDDASTPIERRSRRAFNFFLCRAWARTASYTPALLSRLSEDCTVVDLHDCYRTDDTVTGLLRISCLKHLQSLNVGGCDRLTDAGVALLGRLQNLQSLDLRFFAKITDAGLQHLAVGSQQLRSLDLRRCVQITDSGLAHLGRLKQLQTLELTGCKQITDAGLGHLAELKELRTLSLSECGRITDAGLAHIARLETLQSLDLACCDKVTDAGLAHIACLEKLQTLCLRGCLAISDVGLQAVGRLKQLQSLSVWNCPNITNAGLVHLAGLQALQSLDVSYCRQISEIGLQHLTGLKQLQTLGLSRGQATSDGVAAFWAAHQKARASAGAPSAAASA